jgi:glycosyltransferase involved in cell wall biosynthesis
MKVLYLMAQADRPGALASGTFLDEELFALAGAGVKAYFVSARPGCDRHVRGVSVRVVPSPSLVSVLSSAGFVLRTGFAVGGRNLFDSRCYRALRIERFAAHLVRAEGIDLIHSHFAWPLGMGGVAAAAATGRPLVTSLRGTEVLTDVEIGYGKTLDGYFRRAIGNLLRRATRTLYFSEFMRAHGVALGADPARTRVIRKGVALTHFYRASDRPALRRTLGLEDCPLVLSVAGLIPRKGIDTTLYALSLLRDRPFQFVVCGEGPQRPALEKLAVDLGLGKRVRFVGRIPRDQIQHYFAACDVFVLASRVEAAGNVLLEAMASARPIVCTDSGGPGEYVRHGRTGLVVPAGHPQTLAAAIGQLLDNPALADRLGDEGRRMAVQEFSYERMVQDICAVYREVLAALPQPSRPG